MHGLRLNKRGILYLRTVNNKIFLQFNYFKNPEKINTMFFKKNYENMTHPFV